MSHTSRATERPLFRFRGRFLDWTDTTPVVMMGSSVEFACLLLVVSTLGKNHLVSGGCSGKCCRGRDLSCSTTDWRMDRVYGTCYCDEGCIRTKDCCFDYFTECPGEG